MKNKLEYKNFIISEIELKRDNLYHITVRNKDLDSYKRGLIFLTDSMEDVEDIFQNNVDLYLEEEDDLE